MTTTSTFEEHPLSTLFIHLPDARHPGHISYPLSEVFFGALSAILSGCNHSTEIAQFCSTKIDWLRKYYPYEHGTPSHDTFERVLALVDTAHFEGLFIEWVSSYFHIPREELIVLDGKRLKGSADHAHASKAKNQGGQYASIVVNAFATGAGISLAQANVSSKQNEVAGAEALLKVLNIDNCCISADANFTSRALIDLMVERKADYILALKGKCPILHQASKSKFEEKQHVLESYTTEEKGHGRIEKRCYRSIPASCFSDKERKGYTNLSFVIEVKRERTIMATNKSSSETHYYITSLKKPLEQVAHKIRAHWLIENRLHHTLDVQLKEDANRSRKDHLAANFAILRKIVLNLLSDGPRGAGVKYKRLQSGWSDQAREDVLNSLMR